MPLDVPLLETDLDELSGLDRYETITWRFGAERRRRRRPRDPRHREAYAPPFLMLGLNLENTTSDQFQLSLDRAATCVRRARLRIANCGSTAPSAPTPASAPSCTSRSGAPLFVAPYAGVGKRTFNLIDRRCDRRALQPDAVSTVGVNLGLNLGRDSDLRLGATSAGSTPTSRSATRACRR